jgi:hypothetical protein
MTGGIPAIPLMDKAAQILVTQMLLPTQTMVKHLRAHKNLLTRRGQLYRRCL